MQAAAQAERRSMTAWLAMVVEHHLAGAGDAESAQGMADADAIRVVVAELTEVLINKTIRKQAKLIRKQDKLIGRLRQMLDWQAIEDKVARGEVCGQCGTFLSPGSKSCGNCETPSPSAAIQFAEHAIKN
jgi:hypothetical protein